LALLFRLVRRVNTALNDGDEAAAAPLVGAINQICRAVGLVLDDADPEVPADVLARAAERDAARQAKDFATSDAIRDELQAAGYVVEDTSDGTKLRPQ
jgi:cysteinyl-tRNA synthetase